jgi:TRAP-type mannitol/chloroaromatic compound transport system substrate-binding protein
MKRRIWVRLGIALAVLAVTAVVGGGYHNPPKATAQAPRVIKMQTTWPAASMLYEGSKMFADRVEKMSGGRLKVEALPAGTIVPPFEVLEATSKKVVDASHAWAGYWVGKNKAAILMTGGPGGTYGMDFVDYIGWMYEGGGWDLYQEFYRDVLKQNVIVFPLQPAGPQAFGWFKRPVKNWADMKGMKCRETGMAGEVFQTAGMKVVNLPGGEILPAAQRGVIDCAEWVTPAEDMKMGFHNVWKYYYTPGMHENVTVSELLINQDVWKSLAPDFQEIIRGAATETFLRFQAKFDRENAAALKELREKHKVQVLRTPSDVLVTFLKTWDQVAEKEAAASPFFKKVLESQRNYAALLVPARRFMYPPYDFAANHYWPVKPAAAAPAKPAVPAAKPEKK